MTLALWCVLVAGLLPYVATGIAKGGTRFDNHDPRAWLAQQHGYRRRANAAAMNAFEAFPLFAAAVLIAQLLRGPQPHADALALGFIALRIAHLVCYLADLATLRSVVWVLGVGCVVGLFVVAA